MVGTRSASRGIDTPPHLLSPMKVPLADPAPEGPTEPIELTHTLSQSHDNVIPTPAGDVHVRPYRSSSNAQLKAVLSFTPRVSALDRQNVKSQTDEFRGFFTLFWIGLALLFLRTAVQSWEENRTPLSWNFGRLITGHVLMLAVSDAVMSGFMYLCVPFVKGLQYGWFRYYWTGVIIQHIFQTSYLAATVWWGLHTDFFWTESGTLVLHCLANLMKMHSYMAHNGMLSTVFFRLKRERKELDRILEGLPGGREGALAEASRRQSRLEAESATPTGTPVNGSREPSPPGLAPPLAVTGTLTPGHAAGLTTYPSNGSTYSLPGTPAPAPKNAAVMSPSSSAAVASSLRQRKPRSNSKAMKALPSPEADLPQGSSLEPTHATMERAPHPVNPLAWSPNERVALLARNIDAMEDELRSNGAKQLVWPQNVSFWYFSEFMLLPCLVYQLEYPRTKTMNPLIVLEKIIATFGTFSLIYLITEHYIYPSLPKPEDSLFKTFANLALPMIVNYLLIFYIIFECVCAGFAELTYFADRRFYEDWWNSTTWDQFARRWNLPVHTFLLRHVYASSMDGLQLSKTSAAFLTFLLSACCHELVMAVVSKKIRPYLFLMQMVQLPMIALGRVPIIKRNKLLGNCVFWIGLMCGFPLLAIGYLVY